MKRPLRPEEVKLWAAVLKSVRPAPGRAAPLLEDEPPPAPAKTTAGASAALIAALPPLPPAPRPRPARFEVDPIEPGRQRRIARERDDIDARIDLHGLGQFAAEDRLRDFLFRAHDLGFRAVLVITGKGAHGDGIIRMRAPEWLAHPSLRDVVAGVSQAHRRHGGEGALYVALKRKREK